MYKFWYEMFPKMCDLLTYLQTYLLTDKQIHRGAPVIKNINLKNHLCIFKMFLEKLQIYV